jgi:hypothetical protein
MREHIANDFFVQYLPAAAAIDPDQTLADHVYQSFDQGFAIAVAVQQR